MPRSMRAVVIRRHGGPEVLRLEEVAVPRPGPGEILLRVEAVALNHLDIFARQGLSGPGVPPIRLPHVSGVDIVGRVAAFGPPDGPETSLPAPGQRVLVYPGISCGQCRYCRRGEPTMCPRYAIIGEHRWGGLAEYVAVPARNVVAVPEGVAPEVAAAVPAVYTTAWRGVITVGRLRPGERVLVVGASGGLGVAQLQIALAAGATVAVTAGSEEKRRRLLELGASVAFDSRADWEVEVRAWTGGEGVDLALDAVGGPTLPATLRCLGMGGRVVLSGATGGDDLHLSVREVYQWHRRILGAPMGNWEDFLAVTRMVWAGLLHPVIHAVYPLEEIARAEREIEERRHVGKIVIRVS
ncbi:MAG: zinc-binding dehydrogenase [Firmicutes bacterium]|nr:zinc-binding dehydrogenase [Bacillota bacterium]